MPISPAQSDQIQALRQTASEVTSHGEDLSSLISQAAAQQYGQVSLQNDTIEAAMRGKIAPTVTNVLAHGNKIGTTAVKQLMTDLQATAKLVPQAGLSADYPPWERQLYSELPPTDALRIASYIRADPSLSPDDKAAIAAAVVQGVATNSAPQLSGGSQFANNVMGAIATGVVTGGNPKVPPAGGVVQNPVNAPGGVIYTPQPTGNAANPNPPVIYGSQFPVGPPLATAYGPCGEVVDSNGITRRLGMLPQILDAGSGLVPPDATVLACRFQGGLALQYYPGSGTWECQGNGSNFACDTSPPVTTLPPSSGDTCPAPAPEPIYVAMPEGYQIVPPGACAAPMPGMGGGGGQSSNSGGSGGGGYVSVPGVPGVPGIPGVPASPSDQAPPPPPPATAPQATSTALLLDDPVTACQQLGVYAQSAGSTDPSTGVSIGSGGAGLGATLTSGIVQLYNWFANQFEDSSNAVAQAAGIEWVTAISVSDALTIQVGADGQCKNANAQQQAGWTWALAAKGESITHLPETYFCQYAKYAYQFSCPQYLVDQSDFDQFYNAGLISDSAWECYTRANGNLPNLHRMARDLSRTKVGFSAAWTLYQRGDMPQQNYVTYIQQAGINNATDQQYLELSQFQTPSVGSVIPAMKRSIMDQLEVTADRLDDGFTLAYQGQFQKWLTANGVNQQNAQLLWQNSWRYPSLSAGIEMFFRFANDDPSTGLPVDYDDLVRLATIEGIAPGWIPRMIALGQRTLSRRDITTAYNIDAIKRADVVADWMKLGYSAADAETLTQIDDSKKTLYQQQQAERYSLWTPKSVLTAYISGSMPADDAVQVLATLAVPAEEIENMLASALSKQQSQTTAACIKGYRRQFLVGAQDKNQTLQSLQNVGVDPATAQTLVSQWGCEMLSRSREIGAEKNVQWYLKGIINQEQLEVRLENLGFSENDVAGYLQEALLAQLAAQQKAIAAANKAAIAAEKAKKAAIKAAEAQAKAAQAAQEKLDAKDTRSTKRTTTTTVGTDTTQEVVETVTQPEVYLPPGA